MRSPSSFPRAGFRPLLAILGSAILLYLLARMLDWSTAIETIRQGNLVLFLLATATALAVFVLDGVRLSWMSPAKSIPFADHIRLALRGAFVSQVAFGVISGDIYRAAGYTSRSGSMVKSASFVVAARMAGFICVGLAGFTAALLSLAQSSAETRQFSYQMMGAAIITLAAGGIVVITIVQARKILRNRKFRWLAHTVRALRSVSWRVWTLSIVIVLTRAVALILLVSSITEVPAVHVVLLASTAATLSSLIPLAIGGLGLREGTYTLVFVLFGMDQTIAISCALLMRVVTVAAATAGFAMSFIGTGKTVLFSSEENTAQS